MKIVKKAIVPLLLFVFANSYAQGNVPEDKYLVGKELFEMIDTDKNYQIDIHEMRTYYKNKLNELGNNIKGDARFGAYDTNEDHIVSLAEIKKGLDWKSYNKKLKSRKEASQNNINRNSSKLKSENDVISAIEETEVVPDIELSLRETSAVTDNHGVEEEMSLEEFKAKFMNKKSGNNTEESIPRYMIISIKIPRNQAQQKLKRLDVDHNGYVSLNEMVMFYTGKKTPYNKLINPPAWFDGYDIDKNNKIDVSELEIGIDWPAIIKRDKARSKK